MMQLSTPALFALFAVSLTYTIFIRDQRYPSYILTANTPCMANGIFPHPNNCSWFYKCENKTVTGYFQKQFFECAPGTVFDDALDICIPKSAADQGCGHTPIQGSANCTTTKPSKRYCFDEECTGTRTISGMCNYQVICSEEGVSGVIYCNTYILGNAGHPCKISSNNVCQHFGKKDVRL